MPKIMLECRKILQQKKPDDYIIATDNTCSVKDFINLCCKILGLKISWRERIKREMFPSYW